MDINLYFPTAIGVEFNRDLADQMLPYAEKYLADPTIVKDNLLYTSTFDPNGGLEQYAEMKPFVNFVYKQASEYLDSLGYDSSKMNLEINMFANEMRLGDNHDQHTHPNSVLSGMMYLKVPNGSSKTTFFDPRPQRTQVALPRREDVMPTWTEVSMEPEPGMFLIWESWLPHCVRRTNNIEARVALVFNLSWKFV